jgi:hypothetical protein
MILTITIIVYIVIMILMFGIWFNVVDNIYNYDPIVPILGSILWPITLILLLGMFIGTTIKMQTCFSKGL